MEECPDYTCRDRQDNGCLTWQVKDWPLRRVQGIDSRLR